MVCIPKTSVSQQGASSENAAFCGTSLGSQLVSEVLTVCRNREPGLPGFFSSLIFASFDTPWNRLRNIHNFHVWVWFVCFFFPSLFKGGFKQIKIYSLPSKRKYKSILKHFQKMCIQNFKRDRLMKSSYPYVT